MLAALDVRRRPLLGVAGALAVAALTVSGCSAGQDAQTVEQTSVVDGTAFQAGQVDLRDVGLRAPTGASYAKGADAYLEGLVVNKAAATDELVSVSSPIAGNVVIFSDGVSAALGLQAASASASASSSDTASPSDSAAPSDTGAPTDTSTPTDTASSATSAAAAPQPVTQLSLPTNQAVQFGYTNQQVAIVFLGLTKDLFPSQSFPVTFMFANGGSVTATISVKLPVDSSLDAPTINTEESAGSE